MEHYRHYFEEALNTLQATWLELKLAKLFGKKAVGRDGNTVVTISQWRGKLYMLDCKTEPEPF